MKEKRATLFIIFAVNVILITTLVIIYYTTPLDNLLTYGRTGAFWVLLTIELIILGVTLPFWGTLLFYRIRPPKLSDLYKEFGQVMTVYFSFMIVQLLVIIILWDVKYSFNHVVPDRLYWFMHDINYHAGIALICSVAILMIAIYRGTRRTIPKETSYD